MRLLYLGNLYHRRDPRPLLRALALRFGRGALDPARVRVDFYGDCRWYRGESVEGMVREAGLEAVVRLHDPVTIDQFGSRKALTDYCYGAVAEGVTAALTGLGNVGPGAAGAPGDAGEDEILARR